MRWRRTGAGVCYRLPPRAGGLETGRSAAEGNVAPGLMAFCRAARQLPSSPGRQPAAPFAAPRRLRLSTVQQFPVTGSNCPPQAALAVGAV